MLVHTPSKYLDMSTPTWHNATIDDLEAMDSFIAWNMDSPVTCGEPQSSTLPSPPSTTQTLTRPSSRLKYSQEALRAFRSHILAMWTCEGYGPRPPLIKAPEPLLHSASRRGNCQIIKMLLEAGADINARDRAGRTPLLAAAESLQGDAVIVLLEAGGVDINAHDNEGQTALSIAVKNDCNYAVDLFLRHGADPMLDTSDLLRTTHSGFTNGQRVVEE
jgi:ankyrin repeat protein